MLQKYSYPIWNFLCFTLILSLVYLIFPYIKASTVLQKETKEKAAITQTNSTSNLWKRGKYSSCLTVEENGSKSTITGEKKRSSEGWISIKWRKNNDSNR